MKKYLYNIMMLAAMAVAGTAFVSCEKEYKPVSGQFTMTVDASKEGTKGTKHLSLDGSTLNATWAVGERVTVYNITKNAEIEGYLAAMSNGTSTTLSGSITGTIEEGDSLKLMFLSQNYSSQNGTLDYIATNCDYAEARVKVGTISNGNIKTTGHASFANQQAIVKFTLKNTSNTPISVTPLRVSDGTHTYTVTPASATSEIYVAMPGFSGGTVSITAFDGDDTYFYRKTDVTFTKGQYYEIAVKMAKAEYVDLGLPSGTKWATFNLGATKPEEYGDYYAWGTTETWYSRLSPEVTWKKDGGYTVGNVPSDIWTRYNSATYLQPDDDAAYANWGSNWCMPTMEQWQELFENCTCVESTRNGVSGYLVTSKTNSNTIFLPSAGRFEGTSLYDGAAYFTATTAYLNSSLYAMNASPAANAIYHTGRQFGMSVRPVKSGNRIYNYTFYYTGAVQAFTVPATGIYELQVWGAQGGSCSEKSGGLGGYATCRTTLTQGETIYIYVGGKGGAGSTPAGGAGGWNGGGKGGDGYSGDVNFSYMGNGGGGGATHISKVNNQVISSGSGQCASLVGTNFIIVAGGGGGASSKGTPGAGGGTEGGKGTRCNGSDNSEVEYSENFYYSTSQSYGANGGNGVVGWASAEGAGGGGGGYYGGTSNYAYEDLKNEWQDAGGCGGNSAYNSSFGTSFSTTAGQKEGNGQAVIRWYGTSN